MTAPTTTVEESQRREGDHEWNAAIHMLAFPSIAQRTLVHVNRDHRRIDWDAIKAHRGWSSGERILIDAGFAFWGGTNRSVFGRATAPTEATIANVFATLSDNTVEWLLEGLRIRRNAR